MKTSDLETGMRVTLRDGKELVVLTDVKTVYKFEADRNTILVSPTPDSFIWFKGEDFNEDFTYKDEEDDHDWDIVKVELLSHPYAIFYEYDLEDCKVLWQEVTNITKEQIEEKLGYKINIVDFC